MIKTTKTAPKGAALTAVLILLAIGTVLIATFFGPIRSFVGLGSKERKRSTLELRAEGALDLAIRDLQDRTGGEDFTTYVPPGGEAGVGEPIVNCVANTPTWNCMVGLVPWPERDCSTPNNTTCLPRFTQTSAGVTFSVWYYPNQVNPPATAFRILPQPSISLSQMALAALTAGELETGEITKGKPGEEEPSTWQPEPVGSPISISPYNPKPQLEPPPDPPAPTWNGEPTAYDREAKIFLVVIEARNDSSGESWKIEALLETGFTNMAEITSGILAPSQNPFTQANGFIFLPSEWTGRVHFGQFPTDHLVRFVEGNGDPHKFHGPVSFANTENEDGYPFNRDGAPDKEEGARVEFLAGMTSGDDSVGANLEEKYAQTLAASADMNSLVLSGDDGGNHVCLKFMTLGSDVGQLWRYQCNETAPGEKPGLVFDPFQKYKRSATQLEVEDPDLAPESTDKSGVYNLADYDMVVCENGDGSDCNFHLKGIYRGNKTFAAQNIFLEGDIVAYDQSIDPDNPSTDMLGLVAENDIVIPSRIPQSHLYKTSGYLLPHAHWLCGSRGAPSSPPGNVAHAGCNFEESPYNGIVNFVSPTEDRDVALANLSENPILEPWKGPGDSWEDLGGWNWYWAWSGRGTPTTWSRVEDDINVIRQKNKNESLEIDAAIFATGGKLNVEGLNEWEINPEDGFAMYAADNKAYKWPGLPDCSAPEAQYYYHCDTGAGYQYKAAAPACFVPGSAGYGGNGYTECDYNHEALLRAGNFEFRVYGGLTTKEYSRTQYTQNSWGWGRGIDVGFDRKTLMQDPRFENIHPPGYPDSGQPKIVVRYIKSYPGDS